MFTVNEIQDDRIDKGIEPGKEQYLDELRETRKIVIPNNLGVSGQVLAKKEVYVQNNMNSEMRFTSDIDNQTHVKEVRNFMIGPVFGHQSDILANRHLVNEHAEGPQSDDDVHSNISYPPHKFKDIKKDKPIGLL